MQGMATALLDTAREVGLIQAGGMIPTILRRALAATKEMQAADA
jgi:aconitate hydratase